MGLEIYNKPTIMYRIEGFSFFICNAWELMLKAHLINTNGISSIFYDKKQKQTISLADAVSLIYTDINQPLRINIEEIISLRNTATHFVTEDDEILYAPFFQANVLSFSEQIKKFHDVDITQSIPQNFLTLSTNINLLSDDEIEKKYSKETALRLIERKNHLDKLKESNHSNDLYINLRINLYNTKRKDEADATYSIDPNADESVKIIKTEIDPLNKYHLSRKQVIKGVKKQIAAKNMPFNYEAVNGKKVFNNYTLSLIMDYYNLKEKHSYTFINTTRYSQQLIEEIVNVIQQNPDVINQIKKR